MFERYLSDVITSYFGQYIQTSKNSNDGTNNNIDIEQIRISAWRGGSIVLHNVQLRHNCLSQLASSTAAASSSSASSGVRTSTNHTNEQTNTDDTTDTTINNSNNNRHQNEPSTNVVPIEIVHGHIGRLEVRIPWKVVRDQLLFASSSSSTKKAKTTTSSSSSSSSSGRTSSSSNDNTISLLLCDVNIVVAPIQQPQQMMTTEPLNKDQQQGFNSIDNNTNHLDNETLSPPTLNDDPDNVSPDTDTDGMQQQQQQQQQLEVVRHEQSIQAAIDAELLQRVTLSSSSSSIASSSATRDDNILSSNTVVPNSTSTSSWKQRLLERIKSWLFSKLSVTIQNIHVRYEDLGIGFFVAAATTTANDDNHSSTDADHDNVIQTPHSPQQQPHKNDNTTTMVTAAVSPLTLPQTNMPPLRRATPQRQRQQYIRHHRRQQQQYRPPFAIGMTLREFTIQSSTTSTATTTTTAKTTIIAATQEVAAYWDSYVTTLLTTSSVLSGETVGSSGGGGGGMEYFQAAFQQLNDNANHHSYVLDPFSPSIEFGLLPPSSAGAPPNVPEDSICNTVDVSFPPCRWNVSKNLFDDLKYLRKSIAKWNTHQRQLQTIPDISSTLYPIRHLRPPLLKSKFHPHQWWQYSYAAVSTLIHNNTSVPSLHQQELRRHKGWIGLAQALGRRNRYVDIVMKFLRHYMDDENGRMVGQYHLELQTMEKSLLVEEVKSFRIATYEYIRSTDATIWMWIQSLIVNQDSDDSNHGGGSTDDSTTSVLDDNIHQMQSTILSADHRLHMFVDMAVALHREQTNIELQQSRQNESSASNLYPASKSENGDTKIAWRIKWNCDELALLVNDSTESHEKMKRHRFNTKTVPVIRLSCAFCQDQELFECGSWNMTTRIGSLLVKDCTIDSSVHATQFPNLVSLHASSANDIHIDDTFDVGGVIHNQNICVQIKRVKWKVSRSRTETNVRVLPLEVVYSTAPFESLSHIFSGRNDDDFSNDYNLIVNRLSVWKNRQQKRLLNALAHKQKQISLNVVVGAPIILVPVVVGPHVKTSLVVFDLGQLHFNSETNGDKVRTEYDDQWLLKMKDIQVKSMLAESYFSSNKTEQHPRYIIEPFSLRFDIFTKVQNDDVDVTDEQSAVLTLANLPRLALNINSTDVLHLYHLQTQWAKRKKERRPFVLLKSRSWRRSADPYPIKNQLDSMHETNERGRRLEFCFVAPIFSVRFETKSNRGNDLVDSIPLFDFALRGIEGTLVQTVSSQCLDTTFCTKVRSLIANDLFQPAGIDFAILLSSVSPELMQGASNVSKFSDKYLSGDNLVTFEYSSKVQHRVGTEVKQKLSTSANTTKSDVLTVKFHELYVEWNPETIAMISVAMWSPKETDFVDTLEFVTDVLRKSDENTNFHDEEFFDAEEDAFYDAESDVSRDEGSRLLSEISESERSSISDFNAINAAGSLSPWSGIKVPLPVLSRPTLPGSPWSVRSLLPSSMIVDDVTSSQLQQFVIVFELSKLRVNFNKESRHRRVISAEMDGTEVRYTTLEAGGSRILCNIGNLTFSDSESAHDNTLYREILGLKIDEAGRCDEHSSLFEMEMITKPRLRKYVSFADNVEDLASLSGLPVFVDMTNGHIHGFDNYFQAKLSPMRFVYLQQLWFEIVDYFFTGIVGYEIWGSKTPVPGDTAILDGKSIGAEDVPFTRFDIVLQSPTILIPVSPCSTDFIRLTASSVSLRNWYNFDRLRPPSLYFRLDNVNRQWYNNCDINIANIGLTSWSGSSFNPGDIKPTTKLSLSWPVGPSAPVNVPKWNVFCSIDETNLVLDRADYALLQHVIQFNIGGASLHMEEWDLFQRLDIGSRTCFNDKIQVHFPYDKKDSTPSTFAMTLTIPKLSIVLTHGKGRDVAIIRCSNVKWSYSKLLDRVSRQNVTCNVAIIDFILGCALLSSEENVELDENGVLPRMEYTSSLYQSSTSEKSLLITNACIDMKYSSWMSFGKFFQDLPLPAYLSPKEAIQVGDRWYKIGDQPTSSTYDERIERLSWILELGPNTPGVREDSCATIQSNIFYFSLINPAVQVSSGLSVLILSIERFDFLHNFNIGLRTRTVTLYGVEFQTRQAKARRPSDFSLIRPWNVEAVMSSSQETKSCSCWSHSYNVTADVLHARTAFSDITVAVDACMNLMRDVRASSTPRKNETQFDEGSESIGQKSSGEDLVLTMALNQHISILWKGMQFVLLDDSGRHFLQDQDLALVAVQTVDFTWNDCLVESCRGCSASSVVASDSNMRLHITSVTVIDCLQSTTSPFREVISVMPHLQATTDENSVKSSGIEIWSKINELKSYGLDFPDITMQYNPSFVVALQRFLGRLTKEVKMKHGNFFHDLSPVIAEKHEDATVAISSRSISPYKICVVIPRLSILLNKEHQNRRLLKIDIIGVRIESEILKTHSIMKGHVDKVSAVDPLRKGQGIANIVLQSTTGKSRFVEFVYIVLYSPQSAKGKTFNDLPQWIKSTMSNEEVIDDILDLTVGTHDIVYVKERTSELLDYLSNGMPGKGMGATSRAAKGFVDERILRKTYASIQVGVPSILVPRGIGDELFIDVTLGNLTLTSWTAAQEGSSQSRMMKILLSGFSIGLKKETKSNPFDRPLMDDLNFEVVVEISDTVTALSCSLSAVEIRLSYMDYVSLKCIIRDNIGKRNDKHQWDNLEKDWARESDKFNAIQDGPISNSMEIVYSSSARVIRYGQAKSTRTKSTLMKATVKCKSFGIILKRDDYFHDVGSSYDMIAFRGEGFECELGIKEDCDQWFNLSLGSIFVIDLGKIGRLFRSNHTGRNGVQRTDALEVLVEGYNTYPYETVDSQLVVKAERLSSITGDIDLVIIISFLSVTAFVEPLQDLINFLTCKWDSTPMGKFASSKMASIEKTQNVEKSPKLSENRIPSISYKVHVRFVSHYGRFIFAADELDAHSRCLIVRGLSIANIALSPPIDDSDSEKGSLKINMDFQDVSSHMNPDLSDIVGIRPRHIPCLGGILSENDIALIVQNSADLANDDLSTPLLLPLTISIEFEQESHSDGPTVRSLAVSVDPVAVLFSNEDLKLVRAVVDAWTSTARDDERPKINQKHFYDVIFNSERLGLGLRKEAGRIVVDNVAELKNHVSIQTGDSLYAVNGKEVSDIATTSLSDMVSRLSTAPRPLVVTFLRRSRNGVKSEDEDMQQTHTTAKEGTMDKINISIASAVITIVEREVPLLKVAVSMTKVACNIMRSKGTAIRLEASSGARIDYYNLKIWGWEPFLDPGVFYLSSSFQDAHHGPKELSIEIGDRDVGVSLNITDSLLETISKLIQWRREVTDSGTVISSNLFVDLVDSDNAGVAGKRDVSVHAANAAFLFAARQKSGMSKPFVFRNRTGISIAFVKQQKSQEQVHSNEPLNYVGEYYGLGHCESSDVTVLSNGEDLKFRIDVNSFGDEQQNCNLADRFPSFTVALQKTAGVTVEPLESLETSRPGETFIPLIFRNVSIACREIPPIRRWGTWLVEQIDEKTVATLGSAIRIVSMLNRTIEIGIADHGNIVPLGVLREGVHFNLPLWIAMQTQQRLCYVKIGAEFDFTPIFTISPDGNVNLRETSGGCIECRRTIGALTSSWLAVSIYDEGGLSFVCIDCTVSIRNLLPVSIEWEIGQDSKIGDNFTDGSDIRSQCLLSGEEAEVLMCNFLAAKIRIYPTEGDFIWSSWTTLYPHNRRNNVKQGGHTGEDCDIGVQEDFYTTIYVKDLFHVHLPLGLRISLKASGIDVTVYSDLWCTNCTSLDLTFGSPIFYEQTGQVDAIKAQTVGEATLKEISSLFESGDFTRRFDSSTSDKLYDVIRISGQVCSRITEECFEYVEVEGHAVSSRWWASENPFSTREYLMGSDQEQCKWVDKNWKVDNYGPTADCWESSSDLDPFLANRIFNPSHRYRRRRWSRTRHGMSDHSIVKNVNAFVQLPRDRSLVRDGKPEQSLQLAIQANGGRWSQIAAIPRQGSFHGVIRVSKSRWLYTEGESLGVDKTVYELCYVVAPLDGDWGLLTRSLVVTSRFLLRNDSKGIGFEIKQTGASDTSSVTIQPGQAVPFHWGSYHLPELVSVRPTILYQGKCVYKWSGGFDPLLIGHLPLRLRRVSNGTNSNETDDHKDATSINAVKVEIEIRPRTGGTGINLAFQEEVSSGEGALFRIENLSPFPIWFCQDDVLANPSRYTNHTYFSDTVSPSKSTVFSLDIPFRQGKYSHRKSAALATLLRVRLALAPLTTRAGLETTKVLSMAIGETVRLNPSKLMILTPEIRRILLDVRIVGAVVNDGPTRVLRLSLTSQDSLDIKPWPNLNSVTWNEDLPFTFKAIVQGADTAAEMRKVHALPSESEIKLALERIDYGAVASNHENSSEESAKTLPSRNLIVSFRAAFSGLLVSLVDSAPSEIVVATFKNINALATWDTLRATDSTIFITITSLQVDNMVPNSPFPVAVCPFDQPNQGSSGAETTSDNDSPLLVVGLSFAPKHKSGILCLKSATIAPRNLAIKVDLAFLVRLQKFALDLREHFNNETRDWGGRLKPPDIDRIVSSLNAAAESGVGRQKIYFGGLTILPCNIKLSVAPARALTPAQAALEGPEIAAIHQAVRKGDVRVDKKSAEILGVKIGSRNKTPLAVVRGLFKSFVVDGLLRLDGASLNFSGVSLRNYTSTTSQLTTALTAHYLDSLRQNLPAVLGSLAAIGNPLGLVRGLGEGVGDFVLEPVRGFQRSVQEMDASYLVDGVARGTLSLTRHTVGGFADSAAMIAETFSKNMAVLTLDRKYAQKRDRGEMFRDYDDINVASGLGSGVQKLVNGFMEGVTGVVRAPIRGAEKHGFEGFAKGIGKGLLGLLVKPIIGISDGFSDVMIGVKGTVEGGSAGSNQPTQVRPRRALYGREKAIRSFHFTDAAASALMLRTRLASEPYLSHLDLGDRVILLSCKRGVMLGRQGEELLFIKLKQIESVELRGVTNESGSIEWGVVIVSDIGTTASSSNDGNDVEVIVCHEKAQAEQLCKQLRHGKDVASNL